MKSRQIQVASHPANEVGPENFTLVEVDVPDDASGLAAGEVLVRNTWTSVDPGLRLRLRPAAPEGYFAAFPLAMPMDGILTVGEVVASRAEGFAVGQSVSHALGWREHAMVRSSDESMNGIGTLRRLDIENRQPQWFLGPLGPMGLTAYSGLVVAGARTSGQVLWVSAAAGAVGSLVAQMAKQMGHRVIGSAGSDEKVAWLRDVLGVDAFNYRQETPGAALARLAPDGIDIYFDNVGGDHLEAALDSLRMHGRVALCGSISEYESEPQGPRNLFLATAKHLTLSGFRGSLHMDLLDEMVERVGAWMQSEELRYKETIYDGLASAPQAMSDMLCGRTLGKTLVRL